MSQGAEIDPHAAAAMEKLTRRSKPFRVLRRVGALARARATLDSMKQAQADGLGILGKVAAMLPGEKWRPLADQVEKAQAAVDELEADWLEGELVPLTEADTWLVRAKVQHMALFLKRQMLQAATTPEKEAANQAAEDTVAQLVNEIWMKSWVCLSVHKRVGKELEPLWPDGKAPDDMEPQVFGQLFGIYHAAFTPTEDELKKSSAPTTRKTS